MVKVSKIVGCSGTYIAYVLIAMYAISCGQNQPGGEVVRQNSAGDSIMSLIEAGRSQNNNLEFRRQSLQKASDAVLKIKIDSIRLAYVSRLSLAYSNIGDSLNFRKANKTAIELAQETADTLVLAEAYWDLAYFYSGLAVKDSAFYYYLKAHEQFNAIQDDYHAARMLYNMAVEQASVKDYTGSEITTINAIELLKPLKKNKERFNCYNNLGSITKELHDFERAIDYYQIALSYAEKLPDAESSVNNVQNNIGNVYKEQGLYSEAILYYQKVLNSDSLLYKNPKSFAISLDNIAYSRLRNNNTENVRRDLEKALAISDSIHDFSGLAVSSYNLAEFHLWNKDTLSARSYAYQAKNYAQQSSNNKRLLETLALITKLDPGNAGALTADYIALNDSLQQAERQIRNKFERIRFETDEVVAQNQLLARQRLLWIGIAAGLLLLAISIFTIIDQRVKNQKLRFQQQQQEANQEI
ncbi:MAG TPA: tetratricopeptide repeat protein, partial [Eudoraea sp.]|nr:tetratricopeptide repeat protein [Eudoraea sp.]